MNKLHALNLVLDGLKEVLQQTTGSEILLADWAEVSEPVLEAMQKTKESIKALEGKLKKTARRRLINAVVEHFKDVCVYSPTDKQISDFIDNTYNGYVSADDSAEGQEFFLWYWSSLDEFETWSYTQDKRINHKETRFFNDIRNGLSR